MFIWKNQFKLVVSSSLVKSLGVLRATLLLRKALCHIIILSIVPSEKLKAASIFKRELS